MLLILPVHYFVFPEYFNLYIELCGKKIEFHYKITRDYWNI